VAAIVFFALMYFSVLPMALFDPARGRGEKDAHTEMTAIREWKVEELKKHKLNFVEITRDKADLVAGVAISCTEKFCGIYSAVGAIRTHTVPLNDIKTWSKIEWEDVPANERPSTGQKLLTGPHGAGNPETQTVSAPR
jgi:hypothetical protein